jgi:hypothetical protein
MTTLPFRHPASQQPAGLRICFTCRAANYGRGEAAARRLAAGLRQRGCEVTFLLGKRGETFGRLTDDGFTCHVFPAQISDLRRPVRAEAITTTLRSLLRRLHADIVHAADLPSSTLFFGAAAEEGVMRVCHHRHRFDASAVASLNRHGADLHLFPTRTLLGEMTRSSPSLSSQWAMVVSDDLSDRESAERVLGLYEALLFGRSLRRAA